MQPSLVHRKTSTISRIVHSFGSYAIVETSEHRCILIGSVQEIGEKCLYLDENESIQLRIDYQYSAIEIDKIRQYFKKQGKSFISGRHIDLKISNNDHDKKGIAISLDVAKNWGLISENEPPAENCNYNIEDGDRKIQPATVLNRDNHLNIAKALEDGDLGKIQKIVSQHSDKLIHNPFQGDRICLQLELENLEFEKLYPCIKYLIETKYFSPISIGTHLIETGAKLNNKELLELGFFYNGNYIEALKYAVKLPDEHRVKILIDFVHIHQCGSEWESAIKIAEAKRNESMIQLFISYGAKRTPWSPQNGHIDTYSLTEDSIEDIEGLSPYKWHGNDWNDEAD